MNYTRAIFLMNETARAIRVSYEKDMSTGKPTNITTFKTLDQDIKAGDYVVVPTDTRHGFTVSLVVETDVEPDVKNRTEIDWIVSIVDPTPWELVCQQEQDVISAIKAAEHRKEIAELRDTMLADVRGDIEGMPIVSIDNGTATIPPPAPAPKPTKRRPDPEAVDEDNGTDIGF